MLRASMAVPRKLSGLQGATATRARTSHTWLTWQRPRDQRSRCIAQGELAHRGPVGRWLRCLLLRRTWAVSQDRDLRNDETCPHPVRPRRRMLHMDQIDPDLPGLASVPSREDGEQD